MGVKARREVEPAPLWRALFVIYILQMHNPERPGRGNESDYDHDSLIAIQAMSRIQSIIETASQDPDSNITVIDWQSSLRPDVDGMNEGMHSLAFDEMNKLHLGYLENIESPNALATSTDDELSLLLDGHYEIPKIVSGSASFYEYLNDDLKGVELTFTEIEIEKVGKTQSVMAIVDEGERSKTYSLICDVDGEVWGMIHLKSHADSIEEERKFEEIIRPLPPSQKSNMIKVLACAIPPEDVDILLESIEMASAEEVDPDTLASTIQTARETYDSELEKFLHDFNNQHFSMTTDELRNLHAILDQKQYG